MDWLNQTLKAAPEITLFIALALGHALGRLRIGSFSLGGVAGSLTVALFVGQWTGVTMPESLKTVCFALFIYAVGFKSGPDVFGGFNRSSVKLVISSVVQCLAALLAVILVARVCGFSKGFAAGLGAGALTATAAMGTAGDALARMGLAPERLSELNSQMAVAFAITYVFGTIGVVVFLRGVAPRLLRVNLKQAARELESELSDGGKLSRPGFITPFVPVVARSFEVLADNNATVADWTRKFDRASIERVLRQAQAFEPDSNLILKAGDVVGVVGRLPAVLAAGKLIGHEVENKEAMSFPVKVVSVVITGKWTAGKTLGQLRDRFAEEELQGVYMVSARRQGLPLPILPKTEVRRGDVLELAGRPDEVDHVASVLGYAGAGGVGSDLAYHSLAIALGILLGLLFIKVAGISLTLGMGGGVLISGLVFGWWHSRYPVRGGLPDSAQWFLSEFGLSAFAAATGLSAGPQAVAAIQQQGVALLFAGAVVTLVPIVVALCCGHFLLKLHPVVLLGALGGGQTVAASLSALNEETESMTPVLGFAVPYAISNVLLALCGPLIVSFS
jgi:aspartate-alanine antiporter